MAIIESNPNDWNNSQEKKSSAKLGQFRLIISMFKDYYSKKYTQMSLWTLISLGFGLVYLISPIDFIPDIPFIGYIDDAVVLAFVYRQLNKELKAYDVWRNSQNEST